MEYFFLPNCSCTLCEILGTKIGDFLPKKYGSISKNSSSFSKTLVGYQTILFENELSLVFLSLLVICFLKENEPLWLRKSIGFYLPGM